MGFCDLPLLIGGDNSSAVRDAQQIQATRTAFAAILGDGSVVAWSALTLAVLIRTVVLCRIS